MKRLLSFILTLIATANLFAQVYPVRTITTVSPPYPTSLEQYANVEDGHISVTLIPNDVALQNYPVRLRLVINGGYYKIYTNPSFVHKSIVLNNGESFSLAGPELAEWFNPDNLIFEGYTKNQYLKTGRLPEGMYQIWFEVYDFYRDVNISGATKEIKATIWTFENDPPLLNFPVNGKEVPATDPQNIILNWTQRQAPFSSAGAANQFKLEVWEVIPDDMNVEEAVRTTRPIYSGDAPNTTFNYSTDQPILFPGKKYAWRVQVYDPSGKNRYKNDGFSEVRWFRFGKDCTAPMPALDKAYFTAASLKWENNIQFDKYEVRWKNKDITNSNWYTKDATGQGATIDKLEQNTNYYVQMRGFCGAQQGEFSQSLTIHTKQDASFACGGAPGTIDSADNVPLATLKQGEIFKAYDFDIETYKVSGGNGNFTGKGFALVPLLKSIKFEVEFSGITVNSKRRMTKGEVKFIYNEKNGLVFSVNSLVNAIIGDKTEDNPYEDVADKKISVSAPIASINVSATGDVTVVTQDGHKQTVRASATNSDMVYIGNNNDDAEQTVVDTKSKTVYKATPEKSKSGSGTGGLGTAAIKQPAGKNEPVKYAVTFLPHTLTTLGGIDYPSSTSPKGNYNNATIGGTEVLVPWKSVESNKIDRLVAAVDGPADSIHFITSNENMVMTAPGDQSTVAPNAPDYTASTFKQLLVTGIDKTDELKAWYPEYEKVNDTTTQQNRILAGQINIAAYDKIEQNVCIVEVNGAAVPDALPIEQELNKIYASALVHWKVTTIKNFNVTLTTLKDNKFDSDHPGSMKYNDCENEVIDAFKNRKDYSSKTVYLFFIGGKTTNGDTKGYMQFNRNFGFIFRDNQDLNELIRTMGHELGHGVFRLRHVFSPECPYPQEPGQTFNLMDYVKADKASTAILLHKYQWKEVHDWDLGVNWFEGGSEGENESDKDFALYVSNLAKKLSKDLNKNVYAIVHTIKCPKSEGFSPLTKPINYTFTKTDFGNINAQKLEISEDHETVRYLFLYSLTNDDNNEAFKLTVNDNKNVTVLGIATVPFLGYAFPPYSKVFECTSNSDLDSKACTTYNLIKKSDPYSATQSNIYISSLIETISSCIEEQKNDKVGDQFYREYSSKATNDKEREQLRTIANVYNQIGDVLLTQNNQSGWQENGDFFRNSYETFKKIGYSFEDYLKKLNEYKAKYEQAIEKLKKLNDTERVSIAVNAFSDKEIQYLPIDLRIKCIDVLSRETMRGNVNLFGNNEEFAVLRLLNYIPDEDISLLMEKLKSCGLMERLDNEYNDLEFFAGDDNYGKLIDILDTYILRVKGYTDDNKVNVLGELFNKDRVYNIAQGSKGEKYLSSSFVNNKAEVGIAVSTFEGYTQPSSYGTVPTPPMPIITTQQPVYVSYDELVAVHHNDYLKGVDLSKKNQIEIASALKLHYYLSCNKNENIKTTISVVIDVGSLVLGAGEISAAIKGIKGIKFALSVMDVASSASSLATTAVEDQIVAKYGAEGQKYISYMRGTSALLGFSELGTRGYLKLNSILEKDIATVVKVNKEIEKTEELSAIYQQSNKLLEDAGKYDDELKVLIDNAKNETKGITQIADDEEALTLTKGIKNLPGPQLPERIASTFENGIYTNRQLATNEKYYKYHGIDNRTGKKYSWFTNKKYNTESELRKGLAIRDDWGVEIGQVTEFDVPTGTWVSEGKAAAQGAGYPGGDYQAVITNVPEAWTLRTDNAFVVGASEIVSDANKVTNEADEINNITTAIARSGEDFTILTNARKLPGSATGIGKNITGKWLKGTDGNAGLFPKSIADKLRGKTFNNFDEFRKAFWKEVANEPNLAKEFDIQNLQDMKNGLAPSVPKSQELGKNIKYVLHHKTPINKGGGVYDMDNLYIVTPKYHKEILDPAYHYGYGY